MVAQVTESQAPVWEAWTEFLALSLSLAQPEPLQAAAGVNQQMGVFTICFASQIKIKRKLSGESWGQWLQNSVDVLDTT